LAPTLSCTQLFQKPLRNIKAEEAGWVIRLIVIGKALLFREVAKPSGHIHIVKTRVFAEGGGSSGCTVACICLSPAGDCRDQPRKTCALVWINLLRNEISVTGCAIPKSMQNIRIWYSP
jgi:hypothetical protein